MNEKEIKSDSNTRNSKPWYNVEIQNGVPVIVDHADADAPNTAKGQSASPVSDSSLSGASRGVLETDATYAVTVSGEVVAFGSNDNVPEMLSHIAWYDADADEFTVLKFVEE